MISGRRGAFAAISGGGIWIAHVAVLAARPEGCVGSECGLVSTAPRATEDLAPVFLAAVALIALSIAGLVARYARGSCRRSLLGASFGLAAAGALALAAGLVLNRLYPDENPLWWLVDTDSAPRLLVTIASLLVGVALLRGRAAHRWVGGALVLASLASLGFNAQDERAVLSLPVGVAWVLVGCCVSARPSGLATQRGTGRAPQQNGSDGEPGQSWNDVRRGEPEHRDGREREHGNDPAR